VFAFTQRVAVVRDDPSCLANNDLLDAEEH
jgi:hypothetical protein